MNRAGYLKRPDCRIYYESYGSGPAMVFAHGLGGNHLSWWQQLAYFSKTHTCVSFAHRGFNPSSAVDGSAAPDAYADDLGALLEELQISGARLIAQSMGGWTCMDYALRHPQRVKSLVMASTSGTLDFRQLEGPAKPELDAWRSQAPKTLADLEARDILSAHGERMAREQPVAAVLYRQISQLTDAGFKAAVRAKIFQVRNRPPSLLKDFAVPVLFLTGDEDCLFPSAAGPALAALAPKGKAVRVPAAGHSVYFERPAEFNRIVEKFHS